MSDLLNNGHPISPDGNDFKQASKVWADSETVTSSVYNILAFGMKLGADRELEACCNWLEQSPYGFSVTANDVTQQLRVARRPKPPTIKEKALKQLKELHEVLVQHGVSDCNINHIREALEELNATDYGDQS